MQDVALYLPETAADWEFGYVTAGVTSFGGGDRFRLVTAGEPSGVTTMGGLRVTPHVAVADLDPARLAVLVLPGAATWGEGHEEVLALAADCLARDVPVAAVCGATYGLARAGLLDDRQHTSNAPDFLAGAPGYAGADRYEEARVVVDRGLVTAPATAPVDFARAVFAQIGLFPPHVLDAWYGLYTTGERRYFDQLTGAA
ncbi:DJ-1/PfpI family protein [Motilibacter rhizosphaerae]|uniref:DJ-1/PfpI family protein n=1 Tax=Motilibacter rhizosphaerae TaxID=598652 RepID=A0A4Q7NQA4_9ACTN|nr:DJ-1/PfpI family protein [Motilibacter rhizosphaerae]RZS87268.1 DJ-1/PfpI family protein [Motilibacter rhizosphaerae]